MIIKSRLELLRLRAASVSTSLVLLQPQPRQLLLTGEEAVGVEDAGGGSGLAEGVGKPL
jgi:hypothetical protein